MSIKGRGFTAKSIDVLEYPELVLANIPTTNVDLMESTFKKGEQ